MATTSSAESGGLSGTMLEALSYNPDVLIACVCDDEAMVYAAGVEELLKQIRICDSITTNAVRICCRLAVAITTRIVSQLNALDVQTAVLSIFPPGCENMRDDSVRTLQRAWQNCERKRQRGDPSGSTLDDHLQEASGLVIYIGACNNPTMPQLSAEASVTCTAAIEYILAELLELAGNKAMEGGGSTGITPADIEYALSADAELAQVFRSLGIDVQNPGPDLQPYRENTTLTAPAFMLAKTSRSCRDVVYTVMRTRIANAVSKVHFHQDKEMASGMDLFTPSLDSSELTKYEHRISKACASQNQACINVTLPSHVRLLLQTVGAAKWANSCGYSLNPANTLRPLHEWRYYGDIDTVKECGMLRHLVDLIEEDDYMRDDEDSSDESDECMCPRPPFILVGEAMDDYSQLLTLNLTNGYFYHMVGNIPSNRRIGDTFQLFKQFGQLLQGEYKTRL